ncbi:MAG: YoaK family protein [Candidatus Nanopelagicales bacterium]
MPDTPRPGSFRLAVALTATLAAVSGAVDVVSLVYAEVFVANQTGNLVVVAAASLSSPDRVALALTALLFFTVGVVLAAFIRRGLLPRMSLTAVRETQLGVELVLIVGAGVILYATPADHGLYLLAPIGLLALAQGIQAVMITRVLGRGVRTVAVTGPLTDAIVGGVEAWGRPKPSGGPRRRLLLLAVATPAGYAVGAALGALAVRAGAHVGLVAAVVLALVAAVIARGVEVRGADIA